MKIALFGLGNIGQRHARNISAMCGHELLGYDVSVKAPGFSLAIPRTDMLQEVWAWQPEYVIIATPPAWHHALATEAIMHHCHVFIEKPIGLSVLEANDLIWLNDDRKTLAVGYQLNASAAVREFSRGWKVLHLWDKQDMRRDWPAVTYRRDILLEYSHELATALLWAGSDPATATIDWMDEANCLIMLGWTDGRVAKIELSANYNGYSRGAWSDRDTWQFSKDENDTCYVDELEAFLVNEPYCTAEEGLAVMRLIERLQS